VGKALGRLLVLGFRSLDRQDKASIYPEINVFWKRPFSERFGVHPKTKNPSPKTQKVYTAATVENRTKMIAFLIRLAINAAGLLFIANLSGKAIRVDNFTAALIAALVLGVANATVKPILYGIAKSMTCALSCLTLGLWSLFLSWLLNAALFYAAGKYLPGFHVEGFGAAMWGALALSIVNALATALTGKDDKDER
jgi:putative membrane protein